MSSDQVTGVTIRVAAEQLGISENAVRQRIKRGSLQAVKVAGIWRVHLPDDQAGDQQHDRSSTSTATTSGHEVDQSALVEQLQRENQRLWEEIEARREELRRRDILAAQQQDTIGELASRVRALSAGQDAPGATSSDDSSTAGLDIPPRRWWRFWREIAGATGHNDVVLTLSGQPRKPVGGSGYGSDGREIQKRYINGTFVEENMDTAKLSCDP